MIRKSLSFVFMCFWLLGLGGFVFSSLISLDKISLDRELPLGRIQGVKEYNGMVYVGCAEYNRVQVYDQQGNYQKYIHVLNHAKDFDFSVLEGKVEIEAPISKKSTTKSFQTNGREYLVESTMPIRLVKVDPSGEKTAFIEQGWFLSVCSGGGRILGVGFLSGLLLLIINLTTVTEFFNSGKKDFRSFIKAIFK